MTGTDAARRSASRQRWRRLICIDIQHVLDSNLVRQISHINNVFAHLNECVPGLVQSKKKEAEDELNATSEGPSGVGWTAQLDCNSPLFEQSRQRCVDNKTPLLSAFPPPPPNVGAPLAILDDDDGDKWPEGSMSRADGTILDAIRTRLL